MYERIVKRMPAAVFCILCLGGCGVQQPEMKVVDYVDLERFMGDWFVIANIPTFLEKDAYNAVENYTLNDDGTIATTFTFNKGSFDGKRKEYTPTAFVLDNKSNALWGMRFIWPIKADFRVVYLAEDYSTTVIGRQKRDFVWIMARSPSIPDDQYREILTFVASLGYDTSRIQKVPQQAR